jgi:hypothetical protein
VAARGAGATLAGRGSGRLASATFAGDSAVLMLTGSRSEQDPTQDSHCILKIDWRIASALRAD